MCVSGSRAQTGDQYVVTTVRPQPLTNIDVVEVVLGIDPVVALRVGSVSVTRLVDPPPVSDSNAESSLIYAIFGMDAQGSFHRFARLMLS